MRESILCFFLVASGLAAAQDVKVLHMQGLDILYLESTQKLYVSTEEGSPHGSSLCVVDPYLGTVDTCYFIEGAPGVMAASDDGQFIYLALHGRPEVARFSLASQSVSLLFALGGAPPPLSPVFCRRSGCAARQPTCRGRGSDAVRHQPPACGSSHL